MMIALVEGQEPVVFIFIPKDLNHKGDNFEAKVQNFCLDIKTTTSKSKSDPLLFFSFLYFLPTRQKVQSPKKDTFLSFSINPG